MASRLNLLRRDYNHDYLCQVMDKGTFHIYPYNKDCVLLLIPELPTGAREFLLDLFLSENAYQFKVPPFN